MPQARADGLPVGEPERDDEGGDDEHAAADAEHAAEQTDGAAEEDQAKDFGEGHARGLRVAARMLARRWG
jgi:uncharacterized membrane protein YkoI